MRFLKPKHRPQPETSFERVIHSQPVFNWFDRYEKPNKAFTGSAMAAASAKLAAK